MSDLNDQQIDSQVGSLIRGHLNDQLDGNVGAASRRFAEEMARARKNGAALPLVENPQRMNARQQSAGPKFGSIWSIGLVGAALAATMMIVSMRHTAPLQSAPKTRPNGMTNVSLPIPGEANVAWKTVDQGIVTMPDGSLARRLKRTTTDKRTFTYPKTKKQYEYIRPSEETVYVGLKQY